MTDTAAPRPPRSAAAARAASNAEAVAASTAKLATASARRAERVAAEDRIAVLYAEARRRAGIKD